MNNFSYVKISDIGTVTTGRTPKTSKANNYGNDYMFIGPTDLHKHFFITESERMVTQQGFDSIKSSTLNGTSVLVGCIGWDMGNVGIVDAACVTNQQINSITNIKDSYNPYYIYYWLKTKKDFLFSQATVTRTPILNKSTFSNIEIYIPSERSLQDGLVEILIAIDKKIELNNQINAELEAMAKTLYDYWFVQFDFPDADGKPYKASGGKMVSNEVLKREIPEGWENGSLDDIGQVVGGSTPSTRERDNFADIATPWITPNDLSKNQGNKFISRGALDVTDDGIKSASLKVYPVGTVLLSSRAPIGYMAIAQNALTTNQGFKSFIPNKGYSTEFVYYSVKNNIKAIEQYSSGSTFKEISGSVLKTVKTVLPDFVMVDRYTVKAKAIFDQQNTLELENQQLSSLRDWLLPMLMNGQVTVSQ